MARTKVLNMQMPTLSESEQRIYNFLKSHPAGVLSTVIGNKPHATVIYFAINKDFSITFTTKRGTKKHDVLLHNNNSMLVAYDLLSQTTVQVSGKVEPIEDKVLIGNAFIGTLKASKMTSQDGIPPLAKLKLGEYIGYKIIPTLIRMNIFIRPDPGGYELFETLEITP